MTTLATTQPIPYLPRTGQTLLTREEEFALGRAVCAGNRAGFDLQLMAWGDGSTVPTSGETLVIVGTDDQGLLHIRIFDRQGKRVTDTDETLLPGQAAAIAILKQQLPTLILKHVLTDSETSRVIRAAATIVDQTHQVARDILVLRNLRLVLRMAQRMVRPGLDVADLAAFGVMGLVEAADRYDPAFSVRFVTYAYRWVWKEMYTAAVAMQGPVLVPKAARVALNMTSGRGRRAATDQERSVAADAKAVLDRAPLTAATGTDDHPLDLVPAPEQDLTDQMAGVELQGFLDPFLDQIPPREREVLVRRFGLKNQPQQTLSAIGRALAISKERVRQLEARAIGRLQVLASERGLDA
jgi:RNA polymerase sigma factor (sigma-70 family)